MALGWIQFRSKKGPASAGLLVRGKLWCAQFQQMLRHRLDRWFLHQHPIDGVGERDVAVFTRHQHLVHLLTALIIDDEECYMKR